MSRDLAVITENEHVLLSALIDNYDGVLSCMSLVRADDFQKESHKRIYSAIVSLFNDDQSIDIDSIKSKLKKPEDRVTLSVISRKNATVNKSSIKLFIESVRKEAQLARIIRAGKKMIDVASAEDASADYALSCAENEIVAVVEDYANAEVVTAETASDEFYDYVEKYKSGKEIVVIDTGIGKLDNLIQGFQPGELIVIMGKTSNGKSLLSFQIALYNAIKNNVGCLLFSMEMNRVVLMSRAFAFMSNMNSNIVRTRDPFDDDTRAKFKESVGDLKKLPLYICDNPMISIHEIQSLAKKVKIKNKNLGLIIVDYIGLVRGDFGGNREQEVASVSRGLKCLAMSLKIPVIGLSQVNRNFSRRSDGSVEIGDARESGSVEQDADTVLATTIQDSELGESVGVKEAVIDVLKQRNGPLGTVKVTHIGRKQMFIDKTLSEYMEES